MKKILPLLLSIIACTDAIAQYNFGISTSNWCSMNSMFLNPANLGGSREKRAVNLLSISVGVDNNAGPFNSGNGLVVAVGDGKSNNMFNYANNSRISMLAPYVDVMGPGVMYRLDKKNSIAITTRLRGINQFSNFDQTLFHTFSDPTFRSTDDIRATLSDFTYTVHLWSELGFSYGGVLYSDKHNKLKVGATLRYLAGIAYVGLKGRNMDVRFDAHADSFHAANVDLLYASNILNITPGQGNDIANGITRLLFNGRGGSGIGGDIGVVYENTPKDRKAKDGYQVKFFASVLDLGSITYKSDKNASETFAGNGYVTGPDILDNVKNFSQIQRYAVKQGFTTDIRTGISSKLYMPSRLLLGGDYNVYKQVYVNLTYIHNLANRQNFGNSFYNQFTVTGRYETKNVTIGLPITYSTLSNTFKTGLGLLAGGFFIGSDDMLAFFSRSQYGLNLYAGLNVPIYK